MLASIVKTGLCIHTGCTLKNIFKIYALATMSRMLSVVDALIRTLFLACRRKKGKKVLEPVFLYHFPIMQILKL